MTQSVITVYLQTPSGICKKVQFLTILNILKFTAYPENNAEISVSLERNVTFSTDMLFLS